MGRGPFTALPSLFPGFWGSLFPHYFTHHMIFHKRYIHALFFLQLQQITCLHCTCLCTCIIQCVYHKQGRHEWRPNPSCSLLAFDLYLPLFIPTPLKGVSPPSQPPHKPKANTVSTTQHITGSNKQLYTSLHTLTYYMYMLLSECAAHIILYINFV